MSEKKMEIQDYLAANVNTFIESLVYSIVKKRPSDPAAYASKWLSDYLGTDRIYSVKRQLPNQINSDSEE